MEKKIDAMKMVRRIRDSHHEQLIRQVYGRAPRVLSGEVACAPPRSESEKQRSGGRLIFR